MNVITLAWFGGWEVVMILAVILIFFGAKRLPELARGLGQGLKEFKKATNEVTSDLQRAIEDEPASPPPKNEGAPKSVPQSPKAEASSEEPKKSTVGEEASSSVENKS